MVYHLFRRRKIYNKLVNIQMCEYLSRYLNQSTTLPSVNQLSYIDSDGEHMRAL